MTDTQIQKSLIAFSVPVVLSLLIQQLYNITDAAIVGMYVGDQGLAAVSNSVTAILKVIINLTLGIQTGVQIVVSQLCGKKEVHKIQQVIVQSTLLGIGLGSLLTACGVVFGRQMLMQLNIPDSILELQYSYLSIQFFGIVPQLLYNMCFGVMRALGNSKKSLIYGIIQSIQNLVLDIYFVGVLKMGVSGAQLATVISQILSFILSANDLFRRYRSLFGKQYKIFSLKEVFNVIEVGLPIGIQTQMMQVQHVIINSVISQFGTDYMIAWSIGAKLEDFIWIVMDAMYVSLTVFAGQNFGAGKLKRIDTAVIVGIAIQALQTYTAFIIIYILKHNILSLMTDNLEIQSLQISILVQKMPFLIFLVIYKMLNAVLSGTGKQKACMVILIQQALIFRVQFISIYMSIQRDFRAIIIAYNLSWTISLILFTIVYVHTRIIRNSGIKSKKVEKSC